MEEPPDIFPGPWDVIRCVTCLVVGSEGRRLAVFDGKCGLRPSRRKRGKEKESGL